MKATTRSICVLLALTIVGASSSNAQTSVRASTQTEAAPDSSIVFEGRGNRLTDEFVIEGPWLLSWRLATDYPRNVGFHAVLVESPSGISQGKALEAQQPGSGYRLFENSGRFRFRVSSTFARWHLTLRPLSEEEAARWQPKRRPLTDQERRDFRSGFLRRRSG